ncbi:sulfatase-like hydrolase/transferase [Maioricimonas sp. JC845]|uniref:sulfatase family protein n=1 Tax=Maioricimonas sp. JC845 TaxID=3232138 RepID=UPI00345A2FB1
MNSERPNIIFIITDQQRFDTIAELGFPYMETPNLDRLVREGTTFTNCHVTAASCAPSRASLFTGYYPHTTGVLKNADLWQHSWIEQLADSGYRCVNIGKMHSYPYHTPLGFHERYVVENKDRYLEERWYFDEWDKALRARGHVKQQREQYRQRDDYRQALGAFDWELPEDLHSDMFVGDMAKWWIETYPVTQPLFLQIGFPGPHPPYDPTPEYAARYMNKELPLLEVTQEELDAQPAALKELRQHNNEVDHDSVVLDLDPTEEQRHRQRAYYLANVTMIDEKIGEILRSLDQRGYLENSVVIFTSDHGDCLTDHGHSQKWTMYDIITRMPMIVWSPGRFEAGRRIDGLCSQFDIGPAILELAGVEPAADMEARSLLPALEGNNWQPRDYVFAEQARDGILTGTEFMTMVRSADWKLVHFLDQPDGQLFDLSADPDEVNNLWDSGDPAHQSKKQELLDELREWRIRSALSTHDLFADHR